jgi:hypothetical protein
MSTARMAEPKSTGTAQRKPPSSAGTSVTNAAPKTEPSMEAMPPTMTATKKFIDSDTLKACGSRWPRYWAMSAPETPV